MFLLAFRGCMLQVEDFKIYLNTEKHIGTLHTQLVYDDQEMEDQRTLGSYNLVDGSILLEVRVVSTSVSIDW